MLYSFLPSYSSWSLLQLFYLLFSSLPPPAALITLSSSSSTSSSYSSFSSSFSSSSSSVFHMSFSPLFPFLISCVLSTHIKMADKKIQEITSPGTLTRTLGIHVFCSLRLVFGNLGSCLLVIVERDLQTHSEGRYLSLQSG